MDGADPSSSSRRHNAVVGQWRDHPAVAGADLSRFLVEQQRQTQAFGHFGKAKNGLPAYRQIDMRKWLAAGPDAIKPAFLESRNIVHRLRIVKFLAVELVCENAFRFEFHFVLAGREVD